MELEYERSIATSLQAISLEFRALNEAVKGLHDDLQAIKLALHRLDKPV